MSSSRNAADAARAAVTSDLATIPTPTPTHYDQVAAQLRDALAEVAKLTDPSPSATAQDKLRGVASVHGQIREHVSERVAGLHRDPLAAAVKASPGATGHEIRRGRGARHDAVHRRVPSGRQSARGADQRPAQLVVPSVREGVAGLGRRTTARSAHHPPTPIPRSRSG